MVIVRWMPSLMRWRRTHEPRYLISISTGKLRNVSDGGMVRAGTSAGKQRLQFLRRSEPERLAAFGVYSVTQSVGAFVQLNEALVLHSSLSTRTSAISPTPRP